MGFISFMEYNSLYRQASQPAMQRRRWYDGQPHLALMMNLLIAMPPLLQITTCEGIITMCDKHLDMEELNRAYKSFGGANRVMAIHKAKMKRRAYDNHNSSHRAFSYLCLLPEDIQNYFAKQIADLATDIDNYYRSDKVIGNETEDIAVIRKLIKAYVDSWLGHVLKLPSPLQKELKNRVDKLRPPEMPPEDLTIKREREKVSAAAPAGKTPPPVAPQPHQEVAEAPQEDEFDPDKEETLESDDLGMRIRDI